MKQYTRVSSITEKSFRSCAHLFLKDCCMWEEETELEGGGGEGVKMDEEKIARK